ncbi:MAG TPA: stage III sporulation protein AA [Candidatus Atribacteria bacterium]|nr:stage III sporulation protein AA [Candidatus Atribacteria bacterium]HPT77875.1 stage III sporulation protein AA [Candidatus Atribacteria bacterium]
MLTAQKGTSFEWQKPVLETLPGHIRSIIEGLPEPIRKDLEEIRVRENRPLMICSRGRDYFVSREGRLVQNADDSYIVTHDDTNCLLQLISDYSIYAFDEEIRNGYITLRGGHRVGMAGKAVLENGRVKTLKYINSFNIRISREIIGAADKAMKYITYDNQVFHTLVLSPPQMGKTTLLRDVSRKLSDGYLGFRGLKTVIVDERSEIAGCFRGVPQRQVGVRTDVLDGCPKADGIMMAIRSMSPRVIITDEIGRPEDAVAVEEALNAGIKIIASAHASSLTDALTRPVLSSLLTKKTFERVIVLGDSLGVGTMEKVYGSDLCTQLLENPVR